MIRSAESMCRQASVQNVLAACSASDVLFPERPVGLLLAHWRLSGNIHCAADAMVGSAGSRTQNNKNPRAKTLGFFAFRAWLRLGEPRAAVDAVDLNAGMGEIGDAATTP